METERERTMEARYSKPYNWCVEPWHRMWRQKNGLWKIAHELTGSLKGKKVLDAGGGDGWYTARISEEAAEAHCIDISKRAIAFGEIINPKARFACGSLKNLPYAPEAFDVITSFQVIEHIPPEELPQVVSELSRTLKRNGLLVVSVPSVNRKLSKAHFQHFTVNTLNQIFADHFEFVNGYGQEHHSVVLHMIERVLQNRIWLLPVLAERFNRKFPNSRWNRVGFEKCQNLVVAYRKV